MTVWPVSLPAAPLMDGFSETPPVTAIRTQMDQGPAKLRSRTTAAVREIEMGFLLTTTQVQTLDDFYVTVLKGGTLSFDFTHPRTGAGLNLRFTAPPQYQPTGNGYFRVAVSAEALP